MIKMLDEDFAKVLKVMVIDKPILFIFTAYKFFIKENSFFNIIFILLSILIINVLFIIVIILLSYSLSNIDELENI